MKKRIAEQRIPELTNLPLGTVQSLSRWANGKCAEDMFRQLRGVASAELQRRSVGGPLCEGAIDRALNALSAPAQMDGARAALKACTQASNHRDLVLARLFFSIAVFLTIRYSVDTGDLGPAIELRHSVSEFLERLQYSGGGSL